MFTITLIIGMLLLGKKKGVKGYMYFFLYLWFKAEIQPKIHSDVDNVPSCRKFFLE